MTNSPTLADKPQLQGEAYTWSRTRLPEFEFPHLDPQQKAKSWQIEDFLEKLESKQQALLAHKVKALKDQIDGFLIWDHDAHQWSVLCPGEHQLDLQTIQTQDEEHFPQIHNDLMADYTLQNLGMGQVLNLDSRKHWNLALLTPSLEQFKFNHLKLSLETSSQVSVFFWADYSTMTDVHTQGIASQNIEVELADSANLEWIYLTDAGTNSIHRAFFSHQAKNSKIHLYNLDLGGDYSRSSWNAHLDGENAEFEIHHLGIVNAKKQVHSHLEVFHNSPKTFSRQWVYQLAAQKGTASFDGTVEIAEGACECESEQLIRSILLSTEAKVRSKPNLRIYNDDVVCSHGNTVGQLEGEQLTYLKSRGLDDTTARQLLLKAFLGQSIDGLETAMWKELIHARVMPTLDQMAQEMTSLEDQ